MNELQVFNNPEFGEVRSIQIDGEPWFVLADVCRVLDLSNPTMVSEKLDDDEKMTLSFTEGHSGQRGGAQKAIVINESGLYTVIIRSNSPKAKPFRRWVTHEVLPSIRKTGSYTLPGYASLPQVISIVAETKKRMKAEGKENWEIAHACYETGENYGVTLPKFFAEDCKMTDEEAVAMADFACEHPEYQQNPEAGYFAFVLSQFSVRQLRGRKRRKLES